MIKLALIISFSSLGFRCITGKGMILYFLRKPFDDMSNRLKTHKAKREKWEGYIASRHETITKHGKNIPEIHTKGFKDDIEMAKQELLELGSKRYYEIILYIMKPILLCSTCMASVHTLIWFPYLTGHISWDIVLVSLIVAFFNTLFYSIVEIIQKSL